MDPQFPAGQSPPYVAQVSAPLLPVKHLNLGKQKPESLDKLSFAAFCVPPPPVALASLLPYP